MAVDLRGIVSPWVPRTIKETLRRAWARRALRALDPDLFRAINESGYPAPVREFLVDRLARGPAETSLHSARPTDVLYVAHVDSPLALKTAIALRQRDPTLDQTLVVPKLRQNRARSLKLFDHVAEYESGIALAHLVRGAKPRVVVLEGGYGFEGNLIRLVHRGRLVVKTSDINIGMKGYDPTSPAVVAQRSTYNGADALFHLYGEDAFDLLRSDGVTTPSIERLPPGCVPELGPATTLPKLSDSDGEVHVVAVNSPAPRPGRRPATRFFDAACDLIDKWRAIVDAGLHLHFYFPYTHAHEAEVYAEYFELARESSHFHIEPTLPFDDLLIELTRYDWGLWHLDVHRVPSPRALAALAPNNLFTLVQAGLPLIVSPHTTFARDLVEAQGNGIVIAPDEIGSLRERIAATDPARLKAAVEGARHASGLDRARLANLILGRENDV